MLESSRASGFHGSSVAGAAALGGLMAAGGAEEKDAVEAYFECITSCSLDDGECVTTCTTILRDQG